LDGQVYAVEDPTVTAAGAQAAAVASAASAALSASLVGAPADTAVATIVGNPASATRVSLSSTYAPRANVGTRVPNITNPLLGGTDLLIGGNIVPTPTQVALGVTAWATFWQGIVNGDGTLAWVTAQVDALRGASTKGNAVRIIGCNGGIRQGFYTRAQYIAAWQAVSDYCASVGVVIYPALGSSWNDFGVGCNTPALWPTTADADDMAAVALALSRMGNIVAFDVVQEYRANMPTAATILDAQAQLTTVFTAIRAAGVSTPLTASNPVFNDANWTGYNIDTEPAFMDFIDRHMYYPAGTLPTVTGISAVYALIGSRTPVVIGEVGILVNASGANRTAIFNSIRDVLRGSRIVGAFAWSIGDQDTVSTNQYGLFSGAPGGALTARTDVTVPFLTWPRRKQATTMTKYASTDQTALTMTTVNIALGGTAFDCGGLGAGGSGVQATIPVGMGGTYRVTLSVGLTVGATATSIDINLFNGSGTSLLEIWPPSASLSAAATGTFASSTVLDLPDGTTLKPTIYQTQTATISGLARRTFLSLERIPAAVY